jgi:PAS domain S-box-containing protein
MIMKKEWSTMKSIIAAYSHQKDIFLSLINEDGTICCANANMIKSLHLQNPRLTRTNFFDLLHPTNYNDFKTALHNSDENKDPYSLELCLKNSYYHPMKWQISRLQERNSKVKAYLCVGHKILDDERLEQFNQLREKNYNLILEGLNTGILFQDKKGELIAGNQKAAEIFNTTLERLYQLQDIKNLWNTSWMITAENGDRVLFENTPFFRAMQSGKAQEELLMIRLGNGKDRWVHFNSQPLFEGDNSLPFSVVSNIVDITQERILSNELKEKEVLFQAFMKQTSNQAWIVDENAQLIFANHSFYQYYELNETQCLNKKIVDFLPARVTDVMYEKHLRVLETGLPVETVEKIKWADGTNSIFHVNIFPVQGVNGKKMVGGHAINLTDRYAVEKQLREANDRLLLLSRTTSDAIWEWDMQSGHIFRNDALMDMIGYQQENAKGLSWWLRRIHPEDRNRVTDTIKDATDKGKHSWEEEYRFKCADDIYKYIHDRGYVVYENGLPVKMIGSLQDVSGLKDLQYKLTEEKLERQREISETVIKVQEKERTRFGHELHDNVNQILSTVKLFADMLTPATKEEKKIKAKIIEYVMMAIDEIRKLSKELVVPQLHGEGLVKSIRKMVDDIHLSKSIKIKFTHDHENDLLTNGKKVTLFRIVQEQMKNILIHSNARHVDIYLHCKEGNTQLIIKDDGIGFNPKQTHQGIGLSNIYERTRFYNGNVDIQTSPGKGCTLTVTIPSFQ